MEIRQLLIFLQVAAVQNFSLAAKELGYSQSNVSAQIQHLESAVGVPLFNRIGRHVSLTQYGEELLPMAQQIISTTACMENFLRSENAMGGTVRVGIVDSLFELLFQPVIVDYHRRFPKVKVELDVDDTASLMERLQQGNLDLACIISNPFPPEEWNCWYSIDVPIVIIANPNDPLCQVEGLTLKNLCDAEFILMEDSVAYSTYFQHAMTAKRIQPKVFLWLESASMACRMVENERFLSVLPYYSVYTAAQRGRVRILKVQDYVHVQRVQMVLHPNKILLPQVEGFLECFREALSSVFDGWDE